MANGFSPAEVVNIAIGVERRGAAFYDTLGRSSQNVATRETFENLAQMEHGHIAVFQKLSGQIKPTKVSGEEAEELAAYFKALMDNAVFSDDLASHSLLDDVNTDDEAIDTAMEAEKDSILFYYQLKEIVDTGAFNVIDQIISEEKDHLRQLSKLRATLSTGK